MFDLAITENGDLFFDSVNKELNIVEKDSCKVQRAMCRIKSVKREWFNYNIGADIEAVIGMPSNNGTLNIIKNKIIEVLTFDFLYDFEHIYIELASKELTSYKINIYLKNEDEQSSKCIIANIDLIKGINVSIGG